MTLKQEWMDVIWVGVIRGQFDQHFTSSFYAQIPKAQKDTAKLTEFLSF